jgi:threonine synthase
MAKEFGRTSAIIPTAGNAGGALAAYCAKADMECTVIMPRHTPKLFKQECELFGAKLILIDGFINDCGKKAMELNTKNQYFDFSTLKEPYRLEGKKTMGYEIAEQFQWDLPEYIVYPAGGGTGLIGIWKAFKELKRMGLIKGPLSKMIAVQSSACAPIYEAVIDPVNWKENFIPKASIANGLAVPYPFGMNLIQAVLKESNGRVCVVEENEILESLKEIGSTEGMILSPEGATTWQAVKQLVQDKTIQPSDRVLLLNTGTGYKYFENL